MGDASTTVESSADFSADDQALLQSLQRGEAAAFEGAVRQYGSRMLAAARQFLRNEEDALDAVQDAFVTAFRSLDRYEGRARLSTWLHQIVVNACLMKIRTQRRRREQPIEELLPTFLEDGHLASPAARWADSAVATLEREEVRRLVRDCIERLPENYRTVLVMRDLQEMDAQTVADLLGISTDLVKVRLHRARQALRTLLDSVFVVPA